MGVGFEHDCPQCGGAGTVTKTRERTWDDLTGVQKQALLEAERFREEGDDEHGPDEAEIEEMREQVKRQRQQSGRPTTPSTPNVGGTGHVPRS